MQVHRVERPNSDYRIGESLWQEVISESRIEGQGGVGKEEGRAGMHGLQEKRTAYAKAQRYHNCHRTDRTQGMREK